MNAYKTTIEKLLLPAGITINGNQPFDIKVRDERLYRRIMQNGSLGLGESYIEGWWDCEAPDQFFFRLLNADIEKQARHNLSVYFQVLKARFFNQQTPSRAGEVAEKHYNIGNALYERMLDKYMMYSCAYWKDAATLDEAQEHKLDLICRKLKLEKGQKVLDIGCGWGGFARYAAEKYQVEVVGITVSKEQIKIARERCKDLPVEIRLQDYRNLNEQFDRIISIGMFEHVGHKNYRSYMDVASRNLSRDGIFLLHCIGGNEPAVSTDPWINRYIFPNGQIPSASQIAKAIEGCFILEDWHNFGLYYDQTLMAWLKNFKNAWSDLQRHYSSSFYRMWVYYLNVCAASFRSRKNNLWQIVLTKRENLKGYVSVR